ncbi:MAG: DUF885 family protein [Gemmatimonadaceae bacterium]|nr:DUF885 family protein [Gemmatimonadaceae bacterium]
MLDAFFAQYYARHPVTATFTGVHAHDRRLPDWSTAARQADVSEMRALHARLAAEFPFPVGGFASLHHDADALDAELARANLEVRIAEIESGFLHDRNPALWTGEAIFGCVSLMIRDFAPVAERVLALRARVAGIPGFLAEMRRAVVEPVPVLWRQKAQRECAAAQDLLGAGLAEWIVATGAVGLTAGDAEVAKARDAFSEAAAWLEALGDADATAYACGEALLGTLLRRGHFCRKEPRTLLARATEAMVEASAQLDVALESFSGSWAAAQAAMVADRPGVAEYYGAFARRWIEIREGVLVRDAVTWPDWPIRYVPIPAWARAVAPQLYWLFYRSPAPFDGYTEYDYVVTPVDASMPPELQTARLSAWNHSVITLNHVVHHGGMGHHVQNWHAIHRSTSRVGTVAAVDAASRIGMFLGGSMAEGWACYATGLAEELGLLSPLEVVSERHTGVRLLARAIVDLRLHLGDWSFDECVRYYESTVGMSREVATAETTKNSMFPATALMYWLGTDGILELRARHRLVQGTDFSLRAFHDELLGRGAIPVLLVSQMMEPGS